MELIQPAGLMAQVRDIFIRSGFADAMGGVAAFDAGLEDLKTGALVVAAELVQAERLGIDLSDAVFDGERFPHTSQLHGTLDDVLRSDVPAELGPWVERVLAMSPLPESADIGRAVAGIAVTSPNRFHQALARFALFEILCLQQRIVLRASGVQLEVLNGRRRDVETLAELETCAACALALPRAGLLAVEDPSAVLTAMIVSSLTRHVESLRDELTRLSGEVHERLQRRKELMALLERVDATDAVIILNAAEDVTGEERLAPAQLRVLHPVLLGELSDDAIHQRLARMPDRVRRRRRKKAKSLLDMIVEAASEVRP